MLWANPLLLLGLISLAGPVIVHLCLKARAQRIIFSTLRFFPPPETGGGKRKIRHWLLLLLRLFILGLLVAAFARPFRLSDDVANPVAKSSRAVAILLDCTASMQALSNGRGGGTCWQAALASLNSILAGLSTQDRVCLITSACRSQVAVPWSPPAATAACLSTLKATNEAGHLADGLRLAATLLDHAPEGFQREIIIVSDLQKTSCQGLDLVPIPENTRYRIMPVGLSDRENFAVEDIQAGAPAKLTLKTKLQNFSPDRAENLPIALSLDDATAAPVTVSLSGGGTTVVDLPAIDTSPGWHNLVVDLQHPDALAADNAFYGAIDVPVAVPVFVVAADMDEKIYRRSSYFVTSALNPNVDGKEIGSFAVNVVAPSALPDLPVPGVVILPPLAELPQGIGPKLESYVEQGGGVLLWTGPNLDLLGYNREFSDILPARFSGSESDNDAMANGGWRLGWWQANSPLFTMFKTAAQGNLALPLFHQRLKLEPQPGAETLAAFDDKAPFLLMRQVGRGRVLLVNSSPNTAWSDWPTHRTFLPVVDQMVSLLAGAMGQSTARPADSHEPTRDGECSTGPDHAGEQLKILGPDGRITWSKADELGRLHHLDCESLGIYEVRNSQDKIVQRFCVNFPADESDLKAWEAHDVAGMLRFRSSGAAWAFQDPLHPHARVELWPWLLSLAVLLLFLETAWANLLRS